MGINATFRTQEAKAANVKPESGWEPLSGWREEEEESDYGMTNF